MNYAIILAAGVGQRMRNGGMPKQFVKLMGKPIVVYTLDKFEQNEDIDKIVVVCHGDYVEHMTNILKEYNIGKVAKIVVGGSDRQASLVKGLETIRDIGGLDDDIVVIHDGVRPLVSNNTIYENVRIAKQSGCAVTVHPVTESVLITEKEFASIESFQKRAATYSMTSPQTFHLGKIISAYQNYDFRENSELPLLDAAMVYANGGEKVSLVKEQGANIKITTPEDYYVLKAMLELEENKYVFGL